MIKGSGQQKPTGNESPLSRVVEGIHHFQNNFFGTQREMFERLAQRQEPIALFITCSDSRIDPCLLTQTQPGELFILRNAGNIVPAYTDASTDGGAATIEYAVKVLGVRDIILCGHSCCGAMKGLLQPEDLSELPAVRGWLEHASATRRIIRERYGHLSGDALLMATIEENVLVQIESLMTHPAVSSALKAGMLNVHGWVYKIETGEVYDFDPQRHQFSPLRPGSTLQATPDVQARKHDI